MGVISNNKNQINCIYASVSDFGKQIPGYLESSKKEILLKDISKTMPSTTQWHELIEATDIELKSIVDFSKVENISEDSDLDQPGYIKVIENNPEAFKGAFVINGDKTKYIKTVTEVLEYFDVDSAGLEKTFHTEDPTTSKTTEDDNFV
ncbi:hypothetical protein [Winogradskyella sp.]|uniref:hypothetical protein n=1 Tax=Winogradskyella sp. TaxID=1883156 RepID=UPI0035113BD7